MDNDDDGDGIPDEDEGTLKILMYETLSENISEISLLRNLFKVTMMGMASQIILIMMMMEMEYLMKTKVF